MNEKKPNNKRIIILGVMVVIFLIFSIVFFTYAFYQRGIYKGKYEIATDLINNKQYNEAIEILNDLYDYKDSNYKILETKYKLAIQHYENEDYENAQKIFTEIEDYFDSKIYLAQISIKLSKPNPSKESIYQDAFSLYENKEYQKALDLYETIVPYKDSNEFISNCQQKLKRPQNSNILAAGLRNSLIVTNNGTVKTAGKNGYGQLNVETWENIISVDIYGTLTIGLQQNGDAKIAGTYNKKEISNLSVWSDLIDIAAGEQFVVGLKSDGTVIADGHNGDGQINVNNWSQVIAIDAGSRFTVGLTEDGELLFAGFDNGQADKYNNLSEEQKKEWQDVVNITASGGEKGGRGGGHTVGLKSNGTLVAVGDNEYGQCDFSDIIKWSNIVKVAAGDWYTVGLKSDGTVVITGENLPGNKYIDENILNTYTNIVDIAAGYGQTLLLTDKGEIICFGFNDDGKCTDINGYEGAMLPQY